MNESVLKKTLIPAPISEDGLNRYLAEIRKFPILSPEEEYMLAKRFKEHGDPEAAAQLVSSHLRLVAKTAFKYRGYGLPISDLIAEGNIGLMQGVRKFDPDRGFRLGTYARWWIKAAIQEFILRSWSMVKLGTTTAQKRLFFNLRRIKNSLQAYEDADLKPDQLRMIATQLGVPETEVVNMNRRMMQGGDASLNVTLGTEGEHQWQDLLVDERPLQDEALASEEEKQLLHAMLFEALDGLTDRERDILTQRRLVDEPKTLEDLSEVYKVSRERIRQIEVRAFEKVQKALYDMADERLQAHRTPSAAPPHCCRYGYSCDDRWTGRNQDRRSEAFRLEVTAANNYRSVPFKAFRDRPILDVTGARENRALPWAELDHG